MRMTFIIIIIIISHNNLRLKSGKKGGICLVSIYCIPSTGLTSGDLAMDIIHMAPGFLQILIRVTAERTPNSLRRERKY